MNDYCAEAGDLFLLSVSLTFADMSIIDDLDDLEVYGTSNSNQVGSQITQYAFEVSSFHTHCTTHSSRLHFSLCFALECSKVIFVPILLSNSK